MARKDTPKTLRNKIDKIRSEYIRKRDADWRGNAQCFTCDKVMHWKEAQGGHFFIRQHDFTTELGGDERNLQPQCYGCNGMMRGRPQLFAIRLQEKYGDQILKELETKYRTPKKWKMSELEELLEHYRSLLKTVDKW